MSRQCCLPIEGEDCTCDLECHCRCVRCMCPEFDKVHVSRETLLMTELATETADVTPLASGGAVPGTSDPLAPDENAPYGYTVDRASGVKRPKKVPGRPAKTEDSGGSVPTYGTSPPIEDLKTGSGKSA